VHAHVCAEIAAFIVTLGGDIIAQFPSPIAGGDGNREFFIAASVPIPKFSYTRSNH
jgi:23S rRNA (cytidine1920-2'-O)/16S rRNA (cytidine1409-2'-O)-methyltransferase